MKFYDKASIIVQSWKWWDWCISARKEAWMAFGWPAWWDWWKWWSVIFVASKDISTLQDFRYKDKYCAENWQPWRSKDQNWANAQDLYIKIPVWTIVKDHKTWKIIQYFDQEWQTRIACKWWQWWVWNIHFKNSIRQFPNFALLWEPWEIKHLDLELQLLADVWLIWQPSVWKSTLINAISSTKAKVAEYHFTTIIPNLWVVENKEWKGFVVIDIPWLIKGASQWKGLWNDFLRHTLKTKIFSFLIDSSLYEQWITQMIEILDEIILFIKKTFTNIQIQDNFIKQIEYNFIFENDYPKLQIRQITENWEKKLLFEKIINFVFTKIDLVNDSEILKELKKLANQKLQKYMKLKQDLSKHIFLVSWATHEWIEKRIFYCQKAIEQPIKQIEYQKENEKIQSNNNETIIMEETDKILPFLIENWYIQEEESENLAVRKIIDPETCRLVFMTPRWNEEAELRFRDTVNKTWLIKKLEKAWARIWDILHIVSFYEWFEDRFIEFKI